MSLSDSNCSTTITHTRLVDLLNLCTCQLQCLGQAVVELINLQRSLNSSLTGFTPHPSEVGKFKNPFRTEKKINRQLIFPQTKLTLTASTTYASN
jgi:hypothetical protein